MDIFEENFIDEFVEIGNDKIPNVRISLAKIIHKFATEENV